MSTQKPHVKVYSDFMYSWQIWKQSRCPSVGEWINKLGFTWTMECYYALQRNKQSNHEKSWKNLKCVLLSERNQCDVSNNVTFWKRQNYGDREKISGCQELRTSHGKQCTEDVQASGTALVRLHWCLQAVTHLSKSTEGTTPRANPNVNYGLQWLWCVKVGSWTGMHFPLCGGMLMVGEAVRV